MSAVLGRKLTRISYPISLLRRRQSQRCYSLRLAHCGLQSYSCRRNQDASSEIIVLETLAALHLRFGRLVAART